MVPQVKNGATCYSSFDSMRLEFSQVYYENWGNSYEFFDEAAHEHLKIEQRQTYQEMQTLRKSLYKEVSQLFGAQVGFADFSMQDMVDNFIHGKPLATLDNGLLHPQAEQIEDFWNENKRTLTLYSYKQEQLDNPLDMRRYKEIYASSIKRYLQQNIDYFINKKLPSEYNV